tara:strand:+ start:76 stop:1179 length:1104 start_codon:yes stop_codon:yes gene_type:complete
MTNYEQVINEAEIALNNGEYNYCINLLNPLLEKFTASTHEGVNIRMILITSLSGVNKQAESIKICKQLKKSKYSHVREEAKALLQILDSPNLKIPDNWNVQFEDSIINKEVKQTTIQNKYAAEAQKYIKISDQPTGETKPFQKGFIIFLFSILLLITFVLSGCVRIENNLDLREIDSINYDLKIDSKYLKKIPWQLNFESEIKEITSKKEIFIDDDIFLLRKKGLNVIETENNINEILKIASANISTNLKDIEIDKLEKNYILGKKYFYKIKFDLNELENFNDLEIFINIYNPSKAVLYGDKKNIKINNNKINWKILPGEINQIEFSFWYWNRSLICTSLILLLIVIAYYIRKKRYELGSNLPQLPS